MKKMSRFTAFTLAETLVTLSIIGVVAALTIPALKNHADEQKFVALTQKAFTELSAATALLETKLGNIEFWDWAATDNTLPDKPKVIYNEYKKVMNTDRLLEKQYSYIHISGSSVGSIGGSRAAAKVFYTGDGMCWLYNKDASFIVDVNCSQEPNVTGIDIHRFYITDDAILPAGAPGADEEQEVWGCTAYVLKHGKMPWLNKAMDKCPSI